MSESILVVDGAQGRNRAKAAPLVEVAVGILIAPTGELLLTTRPPGKVYEDHWEFPGGKLEAGESVEEALRRELQEEIGITIGRAVLWREQVVDYPHALVRLHFCKVHEWTGDLHMREGQRFSWQKLPVQCAPVLAGTLPVLQWLAQEQVLNGKTT
ncbi:MAG TPA: NUDIX domain-containing protein [Hydrogenophaga sp.]|nr:NUDIX domain-containing protein [Hydrogenophaga sp.]